MKVAVIEDTHVSINKIINEKINQIIKVGCHYCHDSAVYRQEEDPKWRTRNTREKLKMQLYCRHMEMIQDQSKLKNIN